MKRDELYEKLKKIYENQKNLFETEKVFNADDDHVLADRLLLEYINDEDITEIFDSIEKWYA